MITFDDGPDGVSITELDQKDGVLPSKKLVTLTLKEVCSVCV
jgi:hypothetical protein